MSETRFGQRFAIDKAEIERSDGKVIEYAKERYAGDVGRSICDEKGWQEVDEQPFSEHQVIYEIRLHVFTPDELKEFLRTELRKYGVQL